MTGRKIKGSMDIYCINEIPSDGVQRVCWHAGRKEFVFVQSIEQLEPFDKNLSELDCPNLILNSKEQILGSLKEDREKQWNSEGQPRGWDCWRSMTFMEMIRAKMDRAIIAHEKGNIEDGIDSLKDAFNYLRKLMERVKEDEGFYAKR